MALVYMDRVIASRPTMVLASLNVHRLLVTAVMVAAKYFDDAYYNNAHWARIGGITSAEMNALELEFLSALDWALAIPSDVYARYRHELLLHALTPHAQCACGCNAEAAAVWPAARAAREQHQMMVQQQMHMQQQMQQYYAFTPVTYGLQMPVFVPQYVSAIAGPSH
jgi:hypothetical protein